MVVLLLGRWLGSLAPKPQLLDVGGNLRTFSATHLLLTACLTNKYSRPVHLQHCWWQGEDRQGQEVSNARSGWPTYQCRGVTNFVPGPGANVANTDTLLPNGVGVVGLGVPNGTTRVRVCIFYSHDSGLWQRTGGRVLRKLPLSRWPKVLRWLAQHGLLWERAEVFVSQWIPGPNK